MSKFSIQTGLERKSSQRSRWPSYSFKATERWGILVGCFLNTSPLRWGEKMRSSGCSVPRWGSQPLCTLIPRNKWWGNPWRIRCGKGFAWVGRVSSLANELQVDEDMSFDICNYILRYFVFWMSCKNTMLMSDSLLTRQRLIRHTHTHTQT